MNQQIRAFLVWGVLAVLVVVPLAFAVTSEQLEWRRPVYIAAGIAGVVAMALLLVQPLLIGNVLPGLKPVTSRQAHRLVGGLLVTAVIVHLAALWITSPPDVVDVLLFRSPTPFSVWGVVAMWAVFAAGLMAALRGRLRLQPSAWRLGHTVLVGVTVAGSVVHALLIEGTMETVSKAILCVAVILTLTIVVMKRWR